MSFDLTNKNIEETFQNLLQRTGSDNHLFDLKGNKIGDLRISGSLIAQQYIVSSSVTNITTQQLSGSTQFGDSSDDTHQFTGNITASGNISASGTIIGSNLSGTNTGDQDLSSLALKSAVSGAFTDDSSSISTRLTTAESELGNTLISSSAQIATDISGSFTAASSSFSTRVTTNETKLDTIETNADVTDTSNVTSAGALMDSELSEIATVKALTAAGISGSFTAASSSFSTRVTTNETKLDTIESNADVTDTGNVHPIIDAKGVISSSLQFDTSDNVTFNNITASGDISASGTIKAKTLDADAITDGLASVIVAEIDNDEIPIAKLAEDAITIAGTSTELGGSITSAAILNNGKATISGSFTDASSSLAGRVAANEVVTAKTLVSSSGQINSLINDTIAATIVAEIDNDEIPIAKLAEDAITIAGTSTELGGSITSAAILNNGKATISGSFENGMTVSGNISASGNISGSTIHAQTLDAVAVTDVLAAAVVSEIDNDEIPIAKLAEDAITIAGTSTELGGSITADTIAGQISADTISGNQINGGTIGSITITDLTATSFNVTHFTSSFITSSTIQTEGSNIFGDSSNDTHTFNGNITASGNISGSATSALSIGGNLSLGNDIKLLGGILIEDVSGEERINFDSGVTTFNEGNNNIDFKVRGTSGTPLVVDAGADAVAIGFQSAPTIPSAMNTGLLVFGNISSSGFISTKTNITASGNISSSAKIIGKELTISGLSNQGSEATAVMINTSGVVGTRELGSNAFTSTTIGTTTNALTVDNATLQLNSGTTFNGSAARTISVKDGGIDSDALAADISVTSLTSTNITASGNISASGTSHTFGNRIKMGDNITGTFDGLVVGGAISASNGLYAERIFSENPTGGEPSIKLSTDQVVEIGDVQGQTNEVILKVDNTNSKITTTSGHQVVIAGQTPAANMELTVAGDISASGVINAPEGVFTDNIEINKTAIPKLQLKDGTNDRKLVIQVANTVTDFINNDNAAHDLRFKLHGEDNHLYLEAQNNNVGIGTNTPGEKLEVIGNISSSGFISASHFSGDGSGLTNVTTTLPNGVISSSLQFGSSDNVTFNNITASGNISSSGTLIGNAITLPNDAISGDLVSGGTIGTTTITALAGNLSLGDNNITNVGTIDVDDIQDDATGGDTKLSLTGTTLDIDVGTSTILQTTANTINFGAHITASGAISSSGNISGNGLILDGAVAPFIFFSGVPALSEASNTTLQLGMDNTWNDIQYGKDNPNHTFAGHITASHNISSSGEIIGKHLSISNVGLPDTNDNATHYFTIFEDDKALETTNGITFNPFTDTVTIGGNKVYLNKNGGNHFAGSGNITASGEISASGKITTNEINLIGSGTAELEVDGHITASGNISSSHIGVASDGIYAAKFFTENNLAVSYNSGYRFGFTNNTPIQFGKSDNPINLIGNVTASGNISASGDILTSGKIFSDDEIHLTDAGGDTLVKAYASNDDGIIDIYQNNNVLTRIAGNGTSFFKDNEGVLIGAGANIAATAIGGETTALTIEGHISSSGDSYFGKSSTDIHTFAGHITASGDISASGDLIASDMTLDGTITHTGDTNTKIVFTDDNIALHAGDDDLSLNLTQTVFRPGTNQEMSLGFAGKEWKEVVTQHITASGNITASGDLFAQHIILGSGGSSISDGAGGISFGNPGDDHGLIYDDGDKLILGYNDSDTLMIHDTGTNVQIEGNLQTTTTGGHITASGNISASGNITALDLNLTGGDIDLKNAGAQSNIKFYCESSNAHYTQLQAAAHADYGGNVTTTLPHYNFSFREPFFDANITGSGHVSSSFTSTGSFGRVEVAGKLFVGGSEVSAGGGGGGAVSSVANGADNRVATFSDSDSLNGEANLLFDGSELTVDGNITSSGNLFVGDGVVGGVSSGYISASNGSIEMSGSGIGQLEVDYRLFSTGSATQTAGQGEGDVVKFGGTATTAGDIYYLKTDGTWAQARANAGGTATGSLAVALSSNSSNGMLLRGIVKLDNDPDVSMGHPVYLDDTTAGHGRGTAPDTGGDFVRVVGHYMSGSGTIYFNPDNTFIEIA